jgi:hypothetical protein
MCDRTCPRCGSTEHNLQPGLIGLCIICCDCNLILAKRQAAEDAPLDEPDPEAWAARGTWVLPGAEAIDPVDDILFIPTRRNDGPDHQRGGSAQNDAG